MGQSNHIIPILMMTLSGINTGAHGIRLVVKCHRLGNGIHALSVEYVVVPNPNGGSATASVWAPNNRTTSERHPKVPSVTDVDPMCQLDRLGEVEGE